MYRSKTLVALIIGVVLLMGCGVAAQGVPQTLLAPTQPAPSTQPTVAVPTPVQVAQQVPAAPPAAPTSVITIQPGADPQNQINEAVYQKVNPSVVQVTNLASARRSTQAVPQGLGSGFVWDTQGNIVTNAHVVQGATQLQVTFADGTTVDAQLVGTDASGDIAVIKVSPQLTTLVPVEQGDLSKIKPGDRVLAIGNPFGFAGTMTQGIVSALGRSIPGLTGFSIPEAIQTDAAINPGNSGGPLLNEQGQVIGVNDQIQSSSGSSSGVGFAIPINIVQRIVPSLIQTGKYQHSYLGIQGGTYSRAWAQALGLPADAKGAYVMSVVPGGPAAQAGLQGGTQDTNILLGTDNTGSPTYLQKGGDLITAVNGKSIAKMDDLLIYLEENTSPGQTVQLTVLRSGGQQQTISLKLGARPDQTPSLTLPQIP